MAEDYESTRKADATANIGYALVDALLKEMDKEVPGMRKRIWSQAQRSLQEYDLLDVDSADWVSRKVADL